MQNQLLIVTQYFPPEMGAPQARLYELSRKLLAAGYSVTVLTAMPNYPTGRVFAEYRGKLQTCETLDGLRVVRTALYPSNAKALLPRLISYLSFALSAIVFGLWKVPRPDLVVTESPPLFLAPAGVFIARIFRAKSILMVSDIWPDILVRMGTIKGGVRVGLALWLERWAYSRFDLVALTNAGAEQQIRTRFPRLTTAVISNGVDTTLFRPELRSQEVRKRYGADNSTFLVCYCGLHGLAQGLDVIIDAAVHLRELKTIRFVLFGDGPTKQDMVDRVTGMKLDNVELYERQPKSEIAAIIASSDAGVVPLACPLPGTMPSKVYEILSSGIPVLVARGCEAEALVAQQNVGLSFEPGNGAELAEAILKLVSFRDSGNNNEAKERCRAVAAMYDRAVISKKTELILSSMLDSNK